MPPARRICTTVQPGGKIEVSAPDLPVGLRVDVVVFPAPAAGARQPLRQILARANGHRGFQTAEEVDAFLRAERDAWDR